MTTPTTVIQGAVLPRPPKRTRWPTGDPAKYRRAISWFTTTTGAPRVGRGQPVVLRVRSKPRTRILVQSKAKRRAKWRRAMTVTTSKNVGWFSRGKSASQSRASMIPSV